MVAIVSGCVTLGMQPPAAAQSAADASRAPMPTHELTTEDVSSFFDGFLPYALKRGDIPGAVVVVVKDGAVLFAKGYGYADVEARRPVDPARTLFRPGSISKTFMWTAVMQLVEAGKIDLEHDVNEYLDFKIPETWPQPITLRAIMTHTAGFEETQKNIGFMDPQRAPTTEQFLRAWIPRRIFPPGQVVSYSNYGAALAGYIVQRVSGEPFEQYIERHIYAPLGMTRSTFRQPLPKPLANDVAKGYRLASGPAAYYEIIAPAPAGSMATTGLDMSRFMIAHLQNGRFGEQRILQEPTAIRMHATAFQPIAPLTGMALGFYHEDRNGQTIIGHSGGMIYFISDMHLFLDAGTGVFISMNGPGANSDALWIRKGLLQGFADRYFPQATPEEATLNTARAHGAMAVGTYETSRRGGWNFGSLFAMLGQGKLTMDKDGIIALSALPAIGGVPKRWHEVQPFMWREVGGSHRLAVQVKEGRVASIYSDYGAPVAVFQPVPAWRSAAWNLPLLILTMVVLIVAVLRWPANALLRRIYEKEPRFAGRELARYRWVGATCLANVLFLGGIMLFIVAVILPGALPLTDQVDPWLHVFQLFGVIGAIGAVVAIHDAASAWRTRASRWARISSTLIALACLATIWFGVGFDLLGPGLHF